MSGEILLHRWDSNPCPCRQHGHCCKRSKPLRYLDCRDYLRPHCTKQQVLIMVDQSVSNTAMHYQILYSHLSLSTQWSGLVISTDSCMQQVLLTFTGKKVKTLPAACYLKLSAERVDMQTTSPMYPRKLVKLISTLPSPSVNLTHHCYYHRNIKV